jgi:hypothetical protein
MHGYHSPGVYAAGAHELSLNAQLEGRSTTKSKSKGIEAIYDEERLPAIAAPALVALRIVTKRQLDSFEAVRRTPAYRESS